MTFYIGLDGHSKTSTFAVINGHGKVVRTQQVITCVRELLAFVRDLPGKKNLIFEESTFLNGSMPCLSMKWMK